MVFIWTTRPSDNLNFIKLGRFIIIIVLGLVIYKLDLPESMRITRIHYIVVLKLADPEAPLMKNISDINSKSLEKVWEIKKILDLGLINNNERKYLIK